MKTTGKTFSLATIVTLYSMTAVATAMGLYAAAEILFFGQSVLWVFAQHVLHVLVLGALVFAVLHVVLQREVSRPVLRLNAMLYRLGAGEAELPPLETRIHELREIESKASPDPVLSFQRKSIRAV